MKTCICGHSELHHDNGTGTCRHSHCDCDGFVVVCPICGKENSYNWPVELNGETKEGGCQDCWERQCGDEWWKTMKAIDTILSEEA